MKQLIPLLAILGAAARPAVASPADTGAAAERPGWQRVAAAEEQGQCQFVLPPFAEPQQAPAAVMLATNSPDFVMVTVAGPRYKDYTAGSNYRAEVMVEGEGVLSPAMVQHSEDGTIGMVAMAIPVDRLADWGATDRMVLRLDGRKVADLAAPGRADVAAQMAECMAGVSALAGDAAATAQSTPQSAAAAPARSIDDALAAAEAAGVAASGAPRWAAARPARPGDAVDAALAAAEQAGNAVGGPGADADYQAGEAAVAVAQAGVLQAKANTFLMMQRMNNYMARGGQMGDAHMFDVMAGIAY